MNILIAAALKKRSLAFVAAAALGGCMVGPDFVKPDPPKDQGYLPDALISETASTNVLGGNAQRFVKRSRHSRTVVGGLSIQAAR